MGDGTQELRRVPLLLEGVGFRSGADQLQGRGAQFPALLPLPGHQGAADAHCGPGRHLCNPFITGDALIRHHLERGHAGAVIDL